MAKITPKENFLKLANGGHPEYVPFFTMMGTPYLGEAADASVPNPFFEAKHHQGGKDMWGVQYTKPSQGVAATMPDTRIIMLDDISNWKRVIHFPPMLEIDPVRYYEQNVLNRVDRTRTALKAVPGFSPFQQLAALMGFAGALEALAEDADEVTEMLTAMLDYVEPTFEMMLDYFKPDVWYILDDSCAKERPFFSPAVFRSVFKPLYERMTKPARERGIPILFHNCGYVEPFLDDLVDLGVCMTDPMQEVNDVLAVKEKYKGKLSVFGCFDWGTHMPKNYPDFDEEEVRQDVRSTIDKYAPGGGYAFGGWPVSYPGDPACAEITRIIRDEAHWYGRKVYGYKES